MQSCGVKLLGLSNEEPSTSKKINTFFGHLRTRVRVKGRLGPTQGLTLQRPADLVHCALKQC